MADASTQGLTEAEREHVDRVLSTVITRSGVFGQFDVMFALSNADRLDRHGLRTRFTAAQRGHIERLSRRITDMTGEI